MSGFRNFILRGNLVELAVAFIMATAFGAVVTAFVAWLTSLMPASADAVFSDARPFGHFLNALVAFVLLAAVVYFFVVVPYTKAKERFFPTEPEGTPADLALLTEIRDLLQAQNTRPA
jgi:large conductance mechanosensitive channel